MKNQIHSIHDTAIKIKEKVKSHPVRIPVRGDSMSPEISSEQKVIIAYKNPDLICVGDILLYYIEDRLVLHRVIYTEKVENERLYLTRGDACYELDDWVVHENNIIGVLYTEFDFEQ